MPHSTVAEGPGPVDDRSPSDVVCQHRVQCARARHGIEQRLDLLEIAMEQRGLMREDILQATAGDRNGKRRAALLRQISPAAHTKMLLQLTRSYEKVIGLERQAYGLRKHQLPAELASGPTGAQQPPLEQYSPDELEAQFEGIRKRVEERLAAQPAGESALRPKRPPAPE